MRKFIHIPKSLILIAVFWHAGFTQDRYTAPVERAGFLRATSYDTLQEFLKVVGAAPRIRVEPLTTTIKGRSVAAVLISSSNVFGGDSSKLRVLLFAQQHGDEPAGKEALTLLLGEIARGKHRDWLDRMDILVVPLMNPDGAELRQRRTSDSIDLNRNHLLLTAKETMALHELFFTWKPEVTMDIHEYSSVSKNWQDSGLVKTADVQLGMLTHPNTPRALFEMQHDKIYPFIASRVRDKGFSFQEYIVGSPDTRIRHSTTEINDGRQSFGILSTLSFIQEGRKWGDLTDHLERRAGSQLASVEAFLEYCSNHALEIRTMVAEERSKLSLIEGRQVVLRLDHVPGPERVSIPVFNLRSNKDTLWTIAPFHNIVKPLLSVRVPKAYLIPNELTSVIVLLRRHHISMKEVTSEKKIRAEQYSIDSIATENVEEEDVPRPFVASHNVSVTLRPGDMIVPADQRQSVLMTIILEPQSAWGLFKYPQFEGILRKTGPYPILRIP